MNLNYSRIGNLFPDIKIGGTPSRGNPEFFGGHHLWVSIRDMNGKSVINSTNEKITDAGVINSNCKRIKKGSLLFSFKLTVGRVAFAGEDLYTNEAIAAFDPENASIAEIDLDYLSLVLPMAALKDSTKNSMGASLLNKDRINDLSILHPTLDLQRQIAAKLKAQLAEVETARKALDTQERDVKKLETQLLESIFVKLKPEKFVKIGDVAVTTSGSTPSRDKKDYWEPGQYAWIKTGEVAYEPIFDTEESISEKALTECSLTLLPPKTVLIAMYGQGKTRGQSAVLEVPATTNQACFAILPSKTFQPEYLQYWLRHSYSNLRSLSDGRGGNQANLNGAILREFTVPLLPMEKQVRLAKAVKTMLDEIDNVKAAIKANKKEIELLSTRLLTQAFVLYQHNESCQGVLS